MSLLLAFALASLVLALTPGPGVLYVLARTLDQGRRAGLVSVAGVALGNLANAGAASLGLAALLAVSTTAFTVLQYAGAAYLVYLGVRTLRAPAAGAPTGATAAPGLRRLFRDGALVAALNPKTALFFAAFLPQFVDPALSQPLQALGFGVAFVAIAAATDSLYVLAAARALPSLARRGGRSAARAGRWASAAVYLGLGLFTALSGTRAGR